PHRWQVGEWSLHRCRVARRLNVVYAPVGVKLLHRLGPTMRSDGGGKVKDLPMGPGAVSLWDHAWRQTLTTSRNHGTGRCDARRPHGGFDLDGVGRWAQRDRAHNTF